VPLQLFARFGRIEAYVWAFFGRSQVGAAVRIDRRQPRESGGEYPVGVKNSDSTPGTLR
jgi:hypothetical protein